MKKKELKRRLAVTQEWLDRFQGAVATETVRVIRAEQEVREIRAELDALKKADNSPNGCWPCPWCRSSDKVTWFHSASELRLHEQTCEGNRNRWHPTFDAPPEYKDILVELNIADANNWPDPNLVGQAIYRIKALKHHARPVCIVCGASAGDIALMRKHMEIVHDFVWIAAPNRT